MSDPISVQALERYPKPATDTPSGLSTGEVQSARRQAYKDGARREPDPEQIERAACALYCARFDVLDEAHGRVLWSVMQDGQRNEYRRMARAALRSAATARTLPQHPAEQTVSDATATVDGAHVRLLIVLEHADGSRVTIGSIQGGETGECRVDPTLTRIPSLLDDAVASLVEWIRDARQSARRAKGGRR